MNFYNNFLTFCNSVGKKPSVVAEEIGLSKSLVTRWKAGKGVTDATAKRIADYFGVPVEYLLGPDDARGYYDRLMLKMDEKTGLSDDKPVEVVDETEREIRERLKNSYAYRVLFDTADGAAESDLLEAAALLQKRKEERGL